jgi:hypothetical protein
MNAALPETDKDGRRYATDMSGKNWYWIVRWGFLYWFIIFVFFSIVYELRIVGHRLLLCLGCSASEPSDVQLNTLSQRLTAEPWLNPGKYIA